MRGLNCTRCQKPLTYPFTCHVFKEDGTEEVLENKAPTDFTDGKGCVFVYQHNDCATQGVWAAKKQRKVRREERNSRAYARHKEVVFERYIRLAIPQEQRVGNTDYAMLKSRNKILLMLPFRREVKKM